MCKFCETMQTNYQCDAICKSWSTEDELSKYGAYMHEYSVAIVKRSWYRKMGKKHSGRTVEFRYRGLGFALNYCPECGRKL